MKSHSQRQIAFIRVYVLQAIIQNFPSAGVQLKELLLRHGLSDARIGDPNARIELRDYLSFFEDASKTFQDPILGARLGSELRAGDFWPMGLLLMQASSIGSALTHFARYGSAFQTATTFSIQAAPEGIMCTYKVHDDIKPKQLFTQDNEFTLSSICSQLRTAFNPSFRPLEVHFEHLSNGRDASLQRIFNAPIRFGQTRNCLIVDRREAEQHYRNEDREFINILNKHMSSIITANNSDLSLTQQIRALVSTRLGVASIELDDLASELGITSRTLQRRLTDEGISLRGIVKEYREQMAEAYLAQRNLSIDEIASALGYAEAAVFSRAFKLWTGKSPTLRACTKKD